MKKGLMTFCCAILCCCAMSAGGNCYAEGESSFKAYLKTKNRIETLNDAYSWTEDVWSAKVNNNHGVVASKIADLDGDGVDELLTAELQIKQINGNHVNALKLNVLEKVGNSVVVGDSVVMSDENTVLSGYLQEDITLILHGDCIGYFNVYQPIQGECADYKIYRYDGKRIRLLEHLNDGGWTDGINLEDVKNPNNRINLYSESYGEGYSGIYSSYSEALSDKLKWWGVGGDKGSLYYQQSDLLCKMTAKTEYPFSRTYSNITSYSQVDISEIKVVLNGKELSFDQPPIMKNDRVMVPLRTIFEELDYAVEWNGNTRTATATKLGQNIIVQIDNNAIRYGKRTYLCDVPPLIISDRTLVPVRAVSECAGCTVAWDGATETVYIECSDLQ